MTGLRKCDMMNLYIKILAIKKKNENNESFERR